MIESAEPSQLGSQKRNGTPGNQHFTALQNSIISRSILLACTPLMILLLSNWPTSVNDQRFAIQRQLQHGEKQCRMCQWGNKAIKPSNMGKYRIVLGDMYGSIVPSMYYGVH